MVKNGIKTRLFRKPGIDSVRRVISKFVKDIVVLIPDSSTTTIDMSWAPKPVYCVFAEKGVIKVQPDMVNILFEHLVACIFLRRVFRTPKL